MRIHFLRTLEDDQLKYLQSLLEVDVEISSGDIQTKLSNTRILIAGRPSQKHLEFIPDLETLIIPWTGIPETTAQVLANFPEIKVHNLHHNSASTAELAIALLLTIAKQIIPFDGALRQGNWQPRYQKSETVLLAGKNALLMGYGEIGKLIKQGLDGLGMNVKVIRRSIDQNDPNLICNSPEMLHQLLPEIDILMLALPLTDETEDLIGEKEFSLMPSSGILINISRGKIVNQAALYQALKEHKIYGAGLDVWYNYPDSEKSRDNTFPGDYPFHELDNLVLSPHRGGLVLETEELRMRDLARLITAAARGDEIPNRVNLDLGY